MRISYITKAYSPLGAVINRYEDGQWRAANRYSNLLFVGVVEALLGKQNLQIIPAVLMFLWVIGLVYLVRQVRQVAGIQWHIYMDIFLGVAAGLLFNSGSAQSLSNILLAFQHGHPFCAFGLP